MSKTYICPHCKKKQDGVTEERTQKGYYSVWPEGKGDYQYQFNDYGDIIKTAFYCPNCDKKIATDENELNKLFFKN